MTIDDVTATEGDGGTSNFVFTITVAHTNCVDITFDIGTADGTAVAGTDFNATNATLTIPPGSLSTTFTVEVISDLVDEVATESFTVAISNLTNGSLGDAVGVATINDDDLSEISIADGSVTEGNSGTADLNFVVTLSHTNSRNVTVDFGSSNIDAVVTSDYLLTNGTLTVAAGAVSATITVEVVGETLDESNETFAVILSNAPIATIADDTGIGTITDDDDSQVSINDVTLLEGDSGPSKLCLHDLDRPDEFDGRDL